MRTVARLGLLAAGLAVLATGCANPRVITKATSRENQIKFAYSEGSDYGLVRCTVQADGTLSDCRELAVDFEK